MPLTPISEMRLNSAFRVSALYTTKSSFFASSFLRPPELYQNNNPTFFWLAYSTTSSIVPSGMFPHPASTSEYSHPISAARSTNRFRSFTVLPPRPDHHSQDALP